MANNPNRDNCNPGNIRLLLIYAPIDRMSNSDYQNM